MTYLSVRQNALKHTLHEFFQEWNKLDENLENNAAIAEFKRKLFTIIKQVKNSLFGAFDILGVKQLTMLRLEFSALNEHKFRHNFQRLCPMRACNTGVEDKAHLFLQCRLFAQMRNDLLGRFSHLPELDLSNIDSQALLNLLLYGSSTFNKTDNRIPVEASIAYIKARNRLNERAPGDSVGWWCPWPWGWWYPWPWGCHFRCLVCCGQGVARGRACWVGPGPCND